MLSALPGNGLLFVLCYGKMKAQNGTPFFITASCLVVSFSVLVHYACLPLPKNIDLVGFLEVTLSHPYILTPLLCSSI